MLGQPSSTSGLLWLLPTLHLPCLHHARQEGAKGVFLDNFTLLNMISLVTWSKSCGGDFCFRPQDLCHRTRFLYRPVWQCHHYRQCVRPCLKSCAQHTAAQVSALSPLVFPQRQRKLSFSNNSINKLWHYTSFQAFSSWAKSIFIWLLVLSSLIRLCIWNSRSLAGCGLLFS